ncbi:hypothetical protein OESDEN_20542 [Oesophagostomum dentatum]|uniref:Uncharacterized protein n=1 Tax=Oesophagostomum dentatum TaxID=61180 RepID=A0A0B1S7C2_OESDE|nr:hypothetical protein OESDEN_20542 [Oesophagostomum dentatum]
MTYVDFNVIIIVFRHREIPATFKHLFSEAFKHKSPNFQRELACKVMPTSSRRTVCSSVENRNVL